MSFKLVAALLLAAVAMTGCRTRQGHFTVISTRTVNLATMEAARSRTGREVEGRHARSYLLFIPLSSQASLEEAIDRAMNRGNGDVLFNAVIYNYYWSILVFTRSGWSVTGMAVNTFDPALQAGSR